MAAPAAELVERKVLMCLGTALICLACVGAQLPWVLDKATAFAEKQFGPSAVYGKPCGRGACTRMREFWLIYAAHLQYTITNLPIVPK